MTTISATEAARRFSEMLDRVRFRRETFVIVRRGEAVARLETVPSSGETPTLRDLLERLARLRTGDPGFADDLEAVIREQPPQSSEPWVS